MSAEPRWFEETLYGATALRLRIDKLLYEDARGAQSIIVFENEIFGRVLALDGVIQATERDEAHYHEMACHVPLLGHGAARRVLIIGGGDGGMLREALKHASVEHVDLVEIDGAVIAAAQRYLPVIADGAFDDRRAAVIIGDGVAFLAETQHRYDVVIVDSSDPVGPNAGLFSAAFYRDCQRCLAPGGILITQLSSFFLLPQVSRDAIAAQRSIFRIADPFFITVPSYFGGVLTLGFATDEQEKRHVPHEALSVRYRAIAARTRRYTPALHLAAFELSPAARALFE